MRLQEKRHAISLRLEGYTYNEIRAKIPNLSKSTISGWMKGVELTDSQKQRIQNKIRTSAESSRLRGAWANHQKAQNRIALLYKAAEKDFKTFSTESLFVVGISLYWAEGAKTSRRFQFMNSDPAMIRLMMKWLRKYYNVPNQDIIIRLYIHHVYAHEDCESFWSKVTEISATEFARTIYKPSGHLVKKNQNYKGCLRIEVRGSNLFWKMMAWKDMITEL